MRRFGPTTWSVRVPRPATPWGFFFHRRAWTYNVTPYLHIKSVDAAVQQRVESEKIPFATAVGMGMFCEPSEGKVDFVALREVLSEVGFDGWATVEQDLYPAPFDKPLPIATRTLSYLRKFGICLARRYSAQKVRLWPES